MILFIAAAYACPSSTARELALHVSRAETAWSNLDRESFESAHDNVLSTVGCLHEPLTATDVAAVHRISAMRSYLMKRRTEALQFLHAARRADPTYVLPESVPPGHPFRVMYQDALRMPAPSLTAVRVNDGEQLLIDGSGGNAVPKALPVFLQHVPADLAVQGVLLMPNDALPDWALPLERPKGPQPALAVVSGALLGTGVAFLGGGLATESRLKAGQVPFDDIDLLADRANSFGRIGQGLLLGGAAVGVISFVVPRRPR